MKRLVGIGVVWMGCTLAWVVLGSTLLMRSGDASQSLSHGVLERWGPALEQAQPSATYGEIRTVETTHDTIEDGRRSTVTEQRPENVRVPIPLVSSHIDVDLELEYRQRGLLWFSTYGVDFAGRYGFQNPDPEPRDVKVFFPLEAAHVVYDGLAVRDASGAEVATEIEGGGASWNVHLGPHERVVYDVAYRTRGTGTWHYRMAQGTSRVTDFRLTMTLDADEVEFPQGTLSPSEHGAQGGSWRGVWAFESLIANQPIGVELPSRINPGPLASRITFFAPIGLLFFFFVVGVLGAARQHALHPMHFFFLGCAFFAFHLLFSYLVDHASLALSFTLSAAVSIFLVISYARLFVGWRFALREMAISQLIYLVLFSASFLLEGFTGLAITIGAILTLFVMMQFTGRKAWGVRASPSAVEPLPTSTPAPRTF